MKRGVAGHEIDVKMDSGIDGCHAPTRNGLTRGNRRLPLNGTQFSKLHLRARKANDNKFIFNLINYPKDIIYT